jgi:hypothetical protein
MVGPATDLAGFVTLGAGAMPAKANALRAGIKAYHGSPYDFDRFDKSPIAEQIPQNFFASGEGADGLCKKGAWCST